MLLGAHIGIAGKFPDGRKGARTLADVPEVAELLGCDVAQIFSKNQMQWKVPELKREDADGFRKASEARLKGPSLVHTSYLLNLASMEDALWRKSVDGLVVEVERAATLGIPWVVFHPGSPKENTREWGCDRVGTGIEEVLTRTKGLTSGVLVETNAGAGNSVGRTFEELHLILDRARDTKRVGICVDTCHVFVSGYPIHEEDGYDETWDTLASTVGLDRVKCFHLNDAMAPLGSNKDRHELIGKGHLGKPFWKRLMKDKRFARIPGYLETPDGEAGYPKDLKALRAMAK